MRLMLLGIEDVADGREARKRKRHLQKTLYSLQTQAEAKAHQGLGNTDAARPLFERSLGIWEAAVGTGHPQVAVSLDDLAGLLAETGDTAGAVDCLERAIAIREKALGPDHALVVETRERRAKLLRGGG